MIKQKRTKILMLVENCYPQDTRVRKEAVALTKAGYAVTVIALRAKEQSNYEEIDDIKVYRVPSMTLFKKEGNKPDGILCRTISYFKSVSGYFFEYLYFTVACLVLSLYILMKYGFDVIHAHNPPDTLSVIGLFYKFLGKKYVFDHHDLSPELYLTRVSGHQDFVYKILIFFEKLSCRFADVIISTNESYREIEMLRHNVTSEKIFIVRNNPIISECFYDGGRNGDSDSDKNRKVLLFIGSINPQDGVDVLLRALYHLVYMLDQRDIFCRIIGGGDYAEMAERLSQEMNLTEYVEFLGPIFDRERLKEHLHESVMGVEPAPCTDANRHSTFVKVMEYMAAGKPVVAFDLKETRYSAREAAVLVEPGDITGFAEAMKRLLNEPRLRERLEKIGVERTRTVLNWENASLELINAYESLKDTV